MGESESNDSDSNIELTYYNFDNAAITSPGYVEIRENTVHLHFPEIPSSAEKPNINYKCVQIFINNHLHFNFDWLPFYSLYDSVRIMDMVIKSYELFCNMIQGYFYSPFPHTNKSNYTYSSIITQIKVKNKFQIYCLEDYVTTSIQINFKNPNKNDKKLIETKTETETTIHNEIEKETINQYELNNLSETPFFFQITIGNNCVFDSKRDFNGLEQSNINFLVQLILHKIIHMN